MPERCQLIFTELVAAMHQAVASVIEEHGATPDVVLEVRASLDLLASDVADIPFGEWFRNVHPAVRDDVDCAVLHVTAEEAAFEDGSSAHSRLPN